MLSALWISNEFMMFLARTRLWLSSIQHGFVAVLPIIFLGALALTFSQITSYVPALKEHIVFQISQWIMNATYGALAVSLCASISYQLIKTYRSQYDLVVDVHIVSLMAAVTLVAVTFLQGYEQGQFDLGFDQMIQAMCVAILFTELFVIWMRFAPLQLSYLDHEIHGQLSMTLRMIIPGLITPLSVIALYYFVLMDVDWLSRLTLWIIGDVDPVQGTTLWQNIRIVVINQLFWFVGIHGSTVISSVASELHMFNQGQNFSGEIINHFAYIGGSGCTLGLVMVLFFSRRQSNRHFARYAMLPSLFNINELVIFGLPIIFNRYLFLPFLLMPLLGLVLTYFVTSLGWVTFVNADVNWSMPFLLSGYLLADHWGGAVLQLLICVLSACVYWPFLKRHEASQNRKQKQKISHLINEISHVDFDVKHAYLQPNDVGVFCRRINLDLDELDNFELYYQPKLDHQGNVQGAEALIRWHHPVFGGLPPSVFIPIAEVSGKIHRIGLWVVERCFRDMNIMQRNHGFKPIPIAINVSPIQFTHPQFVSELKRLIKQYDVNPRMLELEITEGQKLKLTDQLVEELRQLSLMGISIAVDDFGMGHTSLHYLKSFPVHTIKIDGEIIQDVVRSGLIQEIVQSMGQLAHGMNAKLVAEWVEEEAQLLMLHKLGCDLYQGKHFSMPLPLPELMAYCVSHQKMA